MKVLSALILRTQCQHVVLIACGTSSPGHYSEGMRSLEVSLV